MRTLILALALSIATHAAGAALPYSRVLLPLYVAQPVAGAFGSMWQSQFAAHNGSATQSYIFEWCSPTDGSACILDLRADEELVPNETQTALPQRYPAPANGVAGAVLYLSPRDTAGDVAFQLRVADVSRSAVAAGTEVPVIRESAFRTATTHLLNIPTDARFRLALRIFEMNLDRADFAVRVYDQATNALLASRTVSTTTPTQGALRFTPGFVEIVDLGGAGAATIRVEVEPLTAGAAFWTYVSITNNDSQQITLVTPQ